MTEMKCPECGTEPIFYCRALDRLFWTFAWPAEKRRYYLVCPKCRIGTVMTPYISILMSPEDIKDYEDVQIKSVLEYLWKTKIIEKGERPIVEDVGE